MDGFRVNQALAASSLIYWVGSVGLLMHSSVNTTLKHLHRRHPGSYAASDGEG
jgi:hypothetical protein